MLMRRIKRAILWWMVKRRFSGSEVAKLGRVKDFIDVRMGFKKPEYVHPMQRPYGFFQEISAKPWHNPADFPWVPSLEKGFQPIKNELMALRSKEGFRPQHQGLTTSGAWNVYYFYTYGYRVEENCLRCPETTRLIEAIPGATSAGLVYFSAMVPGTHVSAHCGPINTRLRCHFGLAVPPDCWIRVGNDTRPWQEGKCIIFDDSFEHEVWNKGNGTRLVLIVDTWHPELTKDEVSALEIINRHSGRTRNLRNILKDPHADMKKDDWWKEV